MTLAQPIINGVGTIAPLFPVSHEILHGSSLISYSRACLSFYAVGFVFFPLVKYFFCHRNPPKNSQSRRRLAVTHHQRRSSSICMRHSVAVTSERFTTMYALLLFSTKDQSGRNRPGAYSLRRPSSLATSAPPHPSSWPQSKQDLPPRFLLQRHNQKGQDGHHGDPQDPS